MKKFNLWLGTLESLNTAMQAISEGLPEDSDREFDRVDNVAIIPVTGSMINRGTFLSEFFGVTSYTGIRNALIQAAEDPEIQGIVLDVASPGGTVEGISDVASVIAKVNEVKPVIAYTGATMASAAYWMASAASEIYASPTATVGSIGVIAYLENYSQALEDMGIQVHVFRSGKYKARPSPVEPMTKEDEELVQASIDKMYDLFIAQVASGRSVAESHVRRYMAEGREFIGQEALDVGLIDGVDTFDNIVGLFSRSLRESASEGSPAYMDSRGADMARKRKKVLTEEAVAAIAEGADVPSVLQTAPDADEEEGTVTTDAVAGSATPDLKGTETPAQAAASDGEGDAPASADGGTPEGSTSALHETLMRSLEAKTNELIEARAELRVLQAQVDKMQGTHDQMREIVACRINHMRVALGGSAMDLSNLPAETLLEEHARVQKEFQAALPVGGKAELPSTEDEPTPAAAITSLGQARLRAVRGSK